MATFLGVRSAVLGVVNVIQWIIGYISGNSLRAKAQESYSQWARVASVAEQISKDPSKAVQLASEIHGMANAIRIEILAYSEKRLDFVPVAQEPWSPHTTVAKPRGLWSKIKLGFSIK
jgi:hypothetical protein